MTAQLPTVPIAYHLQPQPQPQQQQQFNNDDMNITIATTAGARPLRYLNFFTSLFTFFLLITAYLLLEGSTKQPPPHGLHRSSTSHDHQAPHNLSRSLPLPSHLNATKLRWQQLHKLSKIGDVSHRRGTSRGHTSA